VSAVCSPTQKHLRWSILLNFFKLSIELELVKIIEVNSLKLISGVVMGLILNIEKLVTL
jgi:hypothetical protein